MKPQGASWYDSCSITSLSQWRVCVFLGLCLDIGETAVEAMMSARGSLTGLKFLPLRHPTLTRRKEAVFFPPTTKGGA